MACPRGSFRDREVVLSPQVSTMTVNRLIQEGDPPASPRGYRIPEDDVHRPLEARYTG